MNYILQTSSELSDRFKQKKILQTITILNRQRDLLLYFSWIISIGLASRDASLAIKTESVILWGITYKEWLYADGYFSLAFAFYSLLFLALMKLNSLRKVWIIVKIFQLTFKLIWIGIGITIFFNLDTSNCTQALFIFSMIYYSLHVLFVFRTISELIEPSLKYQKVAFSPQIFPLVQENMCGNITKGNISSKQMIHSRQDHLSSIPKQRSSQHKEKVSFRNSSIDIEMSPQSSQYQYGKTNKDFILQIREATKAPQAFDSKNLNQKNKDHLPLFSQCLQPTPMLKTKKLHWYRSIIKNKRLEIHNPPKIQISLVKVAIFQKRITMNFDQFDLSIQDQFTPNNSNQLQKLITMSDQKGFLKKYPKVQPGSHEWKLVQFKLQLSLGTSAVVVKKIYDISSTHLSSAFSSNAKGSIILESFMPTDQLNESNKLFKVCQKGYQFSETGMIFNVGFYRIRDTKKEISCVMNKISVGKSYCYGKNKFINEPITCPEGFESIYLYNEDENPQVFKHQYVVFKNYQVLPIYVIDYVVDTQKQQQSKAPLCENCNKIPPENAKYYCITQNAHFCMECDQEYHAPKLASKHQRVQISQKPKKFGQCDKHENVELQLYCSSCSQALCVNCKIFGNHMSGQMARHSLIKLKDAYSQISSKVKEIDPNIERRKNQLTDDLSKIDLKIKEINAKATHIQEQLYAIFQKALKQLQNQTEKKLSFLICDQLELKRQYDHILWMDSFIKHQLDIQEPHEFLNSWNKFSRYKKQVLSLGNLSINTEVKADMKLEGEIKITVQGKSKQGNTNSQNTERMAALMNEFSTPQKDRQKSTADKDLGSTQLRKMIFKKHYTQKIKQMGHHEPHTVKGSMSTLNKITQDYKQ